MVACAYCADIESVDFKGFKEKYAIIRQTRPETNDFWASGYYCGTAGHVSAEVVARYIRENSRKF